MPHATRNAARPMLAATTLVALQGLASAASAQCTTPWATLGLASPLPRDQSAMTYDTARGKLFLYGGFDGNNFNALGDAWGYTAAGWSQISQGATTPGARYNFGMAYDSGRSRVVLFGGVSSSAGTVVGDTWEWNGTAWAQVSSSGPAARQGHAIAYDSGRSRVVLFGGRDANSVPFGDTWEFDGSTAAWTQRMPAAAPSARDGHVMAFDSSRNRTVLFGGNTEGGPNGETWEWNGTGWQPFISGGPDARTNSTMVYDSSRARLVLYGGAGQVFFNDTWERVGTTWTQAVLTASPPGRYLHTLGYDAGRGVVALFSGNNGTRDLGDTWEWRCGGGCYPNCDGSTVAPILNVADFVCFLNKYAAGDPSANCDGSSVPPTLNVADFICFQNRYAAGCP